MSISPEPSVIIPVFDQGFSHAGWTVLCMPQSLARRLLSGDAAGVSQEEWLTHVSFLGSGVLSAPTDSALASQARVHRRMRRTIKQRRQRIRHLGQIMHACGLIAREPGDGIAPWRLAVAALDGHRRLSGPELFQVLRWYAHNRGPYCSWGSLDATAKLETGRKLTQEYGTSTFAHTFAAAMARRQRFSELQSAFDRETVVIPEIRHILNAHVGHLAGLTPTLISALLDNVHGREEKALLASCGIRLPRNHEGGMLTGQLRPRFDNRVIGTCPLDRVNVPLKSSPEFLAFRWARLLGNVRVTAPIERPLTAAERQSLHARMQERGFLTASEFLAAVSAVTGLDAESHTNAARMMTVPDADEALVLDYARRFIPTARSQGANKVFASDIWPLLDDKAQRVTLNHLRRGGMLTPAFLAKFSERIPGLAQALAKWSEALTERRETGITCAPPSGRAPYSAARMKQAVAEILAGDDPTSAGGCLFRPDLSLHDRPLTEKTNNHAVRHRVFLLKRLLRNIVRKYADGDYRRVAAVIMETSRELSEFSGMTAKEVGAELNARARPHHDAEMALREAGIAHPSPGAVRKMIIAQALDFRCVFTGYDYHNHIVDFGRKTDNADLMSLEFEHIFPRSDYATDALQALTLCPKAVNLAKNRRTALEFVKAMQGQRIPNTNLFVKSLEEYTNDIKGRLAIEEKAKRKLDAQERYSGHLAVRISRLRRLLTEKSAGGFRGTHSSTYDHITKLAGAELLKAFAHLPPEERPPVRFVSGAITGLVRKSWKLNRTLGDVIGFPRVPMDEVLRALDLPPHPAQNGGLWLPLCVRQGKQLQWAKDVPLATLEQVRAAAMGEYPEQAKALANLIAAYPEPHKAVFREVTDLHHALDAIVIAFSALLLPNQHNCHTLLQKRHLCRAEMATLRAALPTWLLEDFKGTPRLADLPPELKARIAEALRRTLVVQHVPKSRGGAKLLEMPENPQLADPHRRRKLVGSWRRPGEAQIAKAIEMNWGLIVRKGSRSRQGVLAVIPHEAVSRRISEVLLKHDLAADQVEFWRKGDRLHVPEGRFRGEWLIQILEDGAAAVRLKLSDPLSSRIIYPGASALLQAGATLAQRGLC